MKSLQYYAGVAREAIRNDNERDAIYQKIHEASRSIFDNPPELKALPWIQERKFVTTAPADALNAAIRTFAARIPRIEIQPLSDAPEEYDRVQGLEEAMTWEFKRMNFFGRVSPHWKVVEYAMKYCAVAIETSYLPFLYQGREKEPRVKEALRTRNFRWEVHDPSNIHVRESDDILECVVNCSVKSLVELIDMFGESNLGVAEAISRANIEKNPSALYTTFYTLYDVTDWEARVKWISENAGGLSVNREAPVGIEIMRQPRTISFLPWVFVDNKEPLLKQMVEAGLWENVNILRTMQFSKAVDMAAHPEYWIQTPDGTLRGVSIDNSNPNQPLITGPATNVQKLPPPTLDPQMTAITGQAESEVFRTTVAQILASVEKYAGTQNFSVVNAMLNAAVAQLSLAQLCAERAETLAMIQNFRWIDETEIPMVAFRETTKGEGRGKGQELVISKGKFDPNYLYVSVKLNPATMMDKQTEINNAINKVERLGMSMKMAWDELGMENYELSEAQKTEEALYQAWIQGEQQKILMAPQQQAQQEQMMQQAMMQQAQAQANPGTGPTSQFSGQESFPVQPGGPPATMPGQGREQIIGADTSGRGFV